MVCRGKDIQGRLEYNIQPGHEMLQGVPTGEAIVVVKDVVSEVCSRSLRRLADKKRHKCVSERRKPMSEQLGAVQCQQCQKWIRSK